MYHVMTQVDFGRFGESCDLRTCTNMVHVVDQRYRDKANGTIHSGHFMISCLNDEDAEESATKKEEEGYNFAPALKDTQQIYNFGPKPSPEDAGIDMNLSKLFENMSLAYR